MQKLASNPIPNEEERLSFIFNIPRLNSLEEKINALKMVPLLGGEEVINFLMRLEVTEGTTTIDTEPYPYQEEDPGDEYIETVPALVIGYKNSSNKFIEIVKLHKTESHEKEAGEIYDFLKKSISKINLHKIEWQDVLEKKVLRWNSGRWDAHVCNPSYNREVSSTINDSDKNKIRSKLEEYCTDRELFDAITTDSDFASLNLGHVNEMIFSYKVQEGLVDPVKKSLPNELKLNHHDALRWDGKEWVLIEWDIDNERGYHEKFDDRCYKKLVEVFMLSTEVSECSISLEQMRTTPPAKLGPKGDWKKCDYFDSCTLKKVPEINFESGGFKRDYCSYYQYVDDVCPVERSLKSKEGLADAVVYGAPCKPIEQRE
ncbi:hypothetical protein ACFL6I_09510 [candidate division KSB1 bacterium]